MGCKLEKSITASLVNTPFLSALLFPLSKWEQKYPPCKVAVRMKGREVHRSNLTEPVTYYYASPMVNQVQKKPEVYNKITTKEKKMKFEIATLYCIPLLTMSSVQL